MRFHIPLISTAFAATIMRFLLAMVALAFMVIVINCATTSGSTPGGGVTWPKVAHCLPTGGDLMGNVSRVLLGDGGPGNTSISSRAQNELEQLAINQGPSTVACLVDEVIRDWTRPGAAANADRIAATSRGRSFLSNIGTQIEHDEGPPEP